MPENIANITEWLIPWILWPVALSILFPVLGQLWCMVAECRYTLKVMQALTPPGFYPSLRSLKFLHRKLRSQSGRDLRSILEIESSEEKKQKVEEWCRQSFQEIQDEYIR